MDAPKKLPKQAHIASAVASVEAEGFVVEEATIRRLEQFASGELSADELRRETLHAARSSASEN